MKKTRIDLTGKKIGKLTVVEYAYTRNHTAYWKCICECGNEKNISSGSLRSGHSRSCGCFHNAQLADRSATHGMSGTKIYNDWNSMIQRCHNPKSEAYRYYGEIGIGVCDEWRKFESFYDYVSKLPHYGESGYTLDRINVYGNYEPGNVRWANNYVQSNNKKSNHYVTYNGKTMTIKEWSDETGIPYYTLHSRIQKRKWDIERAIITPVKERRRNGKR